MGKNIIIEEIGKGGIVIYQTPDGKTSLDVKLEILVISHSPAASRPQQAPVFTQLGPLKRKCPHWLWPARTIAFEEI